MWYEKTRTEVRVSVLCVRSDRKNPTEPIRKIQVVVRLAVRAVDRLVATAGMNLALHPGKQPVYVNETAGNVNAFHDADGTDERFGRSGPHALLDGDAIAFLDLRDDRRVIVVERIPTRFPDAEFDETVVLVVATVPHRACYEIAASALHYCGHDGLLLYEPSEELVGQPKAVFV